MEGGFQESQLVQRLMPSLERHYLSYGRFSPRVAALAPFPRQARLPLAPRHDGRRIYRLSPILTPHPPLAHKRGGALQGQSTPLEISNNSIALPLEKKKCPCMAPISPLLSITDTTINYRQCTTTADEGW
ncbi:hypothetical protein CEXT_175711 [Caerostris extrusa]|uniref:Uncharacterized protein n=1 Tax=Caerostris extrusa TaxID=172846 RepID=A0AAV4MBF7_CAEEX|nr:hypothetical protein CEXT_175711 [Caerostris extrusa]